MRNTVQDLVKSDLDPQDAFKATIQRMGQPTLLQPECNKAQQTRHSEHPFRSLGAVAGLVVVLALGVSGSLP